MDDIKKISILMPVYATPVEWVREAVTSIMNQTWEGPRQFVIVNDNNPPGELLSYLYDELSPKACCIAIVSTKENKGIAHALDTGLDYCTGDLIVRMDADDIARKDLLQKHADYFNAHPDRHICGVQIRLFSEQREWESNHPEVITKEVAKADNGHWIVNHPGIAYRAEAIRAVGGYGDTPPTLSEDYHLWIKFLLAGYVIYNRKEILMDYRVHPKSFSFAPDRKSAEWHEFLRQQKSLL